MFQLASRLPALAMCLVFVCLAAARAAEPKDEEPKDPDFKVQGEYSGEVDTPEGRKKVGVQVVALGGGKFHAVGYLGGLPGDGWDKNEKKEADGQTTDGVTDLVDGTNKVAQIKDGVIKFRGANGPEIKKIGRQSPTLDAKPPQGAVVLFDGANAEQFDGGRITADGLLLPGATSKRKFQDCTLHVEFRLPFMPQERGQKRGNSGCYLQGRYEAQILDSFGLKGDDHECGGIYSIKAPDVNMCLPPLAWQTYDVDYTAAKYENGKKIKNATMTVQHNGVLIHKDVELPHATTAASLAEGPDPGPIYLQDHGNPVRFRNVWVVEKK
jgi:hypothetical protein